jgi:hypothetical protein
MQTEIPSNEAYRLFYEQMGWLKMVYQPQIAAEGQASAD